MEETKDNNLCHDVPDGNTNTSGKTTGGCACYRWAFTLTVGDVPIVPKEIWTTLNTYCKEFYFQLEEAESGYIHYQGCFSLHVKHRRGELKNIISDQIHLKKCYNWFSCKNYCQKVETRIQGPWNHNSTFIESKLNESMLYPWQNDVISLIKEKANDRHIYWYYDKDGGKGKSSFSKYLYIHYNALIIDSGKKSDIAYAYDNNPVVIFDFPRTLEGKISYGAIESIKNGIIFSTKYKSKLKVISDNEIPHVLIFSNWKPDLNAMSLDRWKIITL